MSYKDMQRKLKLLEAETDRQTTPSQGFVHVCVNLTAADYALAIEDAEATVEQRDEVWMRYGMDRCINPGERVLLTLHVETHYWKDYLEPGRPAWVCKRADYAPPEEWAGIQTRVCLVDARSGQHRLGGWTIPIEECAA